MIALARLGTRRPVAITVLAAAISIVGWIGWGRLSVDLLPDVQSPTIVVSVRSGDRPPAEMERLYGETVEQRLFTVRGMRDVSEVARTGRLLATVTFDRGVDMDLALVDVQKAVGALSADPDVDEILVRRFDPRQAPVLSAGLVADERRLDLAELRRVARRQVAPALERLPGVAEVRVLGGREREVAVNVDPYRLEAFGLTLGEIEARLVAANLDLNAGTLEHRDKVFLVRGLARFRSPADVAAVTLGFRDVEGGGRQPIRVRDVAHVEERDAEHAHVVRVDGREGVGLFVYKEAGANTVAVSRAVRRGLGQLERGLADLSFVVVSDEATLVEEAIADVRGAVLVGLLLAVGVLVFFLRSAAPTVVVAASIPVSLLATLCLMSFAGFSLNVMTLAGLALGAGMLIDNAIVVVEATFRRLAEGQEVARAAAEGASEVMGAIAASTLTTCVVFLPVLFLRGLAARLVSGLSFTVVVALVASFFVAMLLIPALSVWLLPRSTVRVTDPGISRIVALVRRLVARPLPVVIGALVLVAASVLGLRTLGTELLPPADPRQVSLRLVGPPGQRVDATSRVVETLEAMARDAAGEQLAATLAEVGRVPEDDRLLRSEQTEENTARLTMRLGEGERSARDVAARMARSAGELPRVEIEWEVGASALARALGTSGPPIVIEVRGESLADLRAASSRLAESLAGEPSLWNVRSSLAGGPPELRIELDRVTADGLGISLEDVGRVLESALDGRRVTVVALGDEERDVVMHLPRTRREELARLPLRSPAGARLTLGDIARFVDAEGAREIRRRNQRRVAEVTARIAPGADYPQALAAAERVLGRTELEPGLAARVIGEEEERRRTFRELGQALGLASLLVFFVLAGKFESLVLPLSVLAALPLALVGVAAALVPVGAPVGVMALLGLVLLAGIAVNDAILLVDVVERLRREGVARDEALARAVGIRLRPILMTTATTALAVLPLAFGGADSAALRAPLALTIVGGIFASTAGSLFVIPCVYGLLDRLRPRRGAVP